tara:strand:+ start:2228 stop:2395 length:168 start_codon:yes stop_codon:yes gene_type:complete
MWLSNGYIIPITIRQRNQAANYIPPPETFFIELESGLGFVELQPNLSLALTEEAP